MSEELLVRELLAQLSAFDTGDAVAIRVRGIKEENEPRVYDAAKQITRERDRVILDVDVSRGVTRPLRVVKE